MYEIEFVGWHQGPSAEPLWSSEGMIPRCVTETGSEVQHALDNYALDYYASADVLDRLYPTRGEAEAAIRGVKGADRLGVSPILEVVEHED